MFTLAVYQVPTVLLAASDGSSLIDNGYEIAASPETADKQTPTIGYLRVDKPRKFCEKLKALDIEIISFKADATCYVDRRLISGTNPKAASASGRMTAETLWKNIQ